ncbi:hypothetical protein CU669_15080 [Paramagnetospirillum kuznetsovii]|uniref:N-acetyltransferase domain-containing protein n=1 Tax=Paramagnetospirillum kuznetsovii TaxID=2053833 RepID=A0A364NVY2_9PROT|nr:GNAT family N-acetyltransferase [Paramagnetospirillum kuznetsovii]RAU21077.1 hypothetical protein CU669_15080 [Paramagnetospirillum kuznetsovii]
MKIEVVTAEAWHIPYIVVGMREADRDEVWASSHALPIDALERSLSASTMAWTGMVDGIPVCMFGVAPRSLLDGRVGAPWMLGTYEVERHSKAFLRRNKAYVAQMLEAYPVLENHVDVRHGISIKWLQWLGFTIGPVAPHGPDDMPFHKFTMRRRVPVVVRACSVSEILANDNLPSLHQEFASEVATFAAPAPLEKMEGYRALEAGGGLQAYGAFMGSLLVGFVMVLVSNAPRISIPIAVADGMFVGREYRKTGAGLKLIRAAEGHARQVGSPCLMIGTPSNGPLVKVLPALGYDETNRVFMKAVRHG